MVLWQLYLTYISTDGPRAERVDTSFIILSLDISDFIVRHLISIIIIINEKYDNVSN